MTTLKDSNMTMGWVMRQWQLNPCVELPNGDVRLGPVRGSFCNLLRPSRPTKAKPEGGWGMVCLIPPGVDISAAIELAKRTGKARWPEAGTAQGPKLRWPIRDQDLDGYGNWGEAERNEGYIKGAMRISASTNGRCVPVDPRLAPIVDEKLIYSGAWYIPLLRCATYDGESKGVTFYLQSVMKVADDVNISGSAPLAPQTAFAGVTVDAGDINPSAAFGASTNGGVMGGAVDPFS